MPQRAKRRRVGGGASRRPWLRRVFAERQGAEITRHAQARPLGSRFDLGGFRSRSSAASSGRSVSRLGRSWGFLFCPPAFAGGPLWLWLSGDATGGLPPCQAARWSRKPIGLRDYRAWLAILYFIAMIRCSGNLCKGKMALAFGSQLIGLMCLRRGCLWPK